MKKKKTKPEKYSSEQIHRYMQVFLEQKDNLEPINATGIARWCNKVLHLEPPLKYTDFTRKPEIKAEIENYNERLSYAITDSVDTKDFAPRAAYYIDIETAMKSDITPDNIRSMLAKANAKIDDLMENNKKLCRQRQEDQKNIKTMKIEIDSLIESADQMKAKFKDQRKELRSSSEEIIRLRKVIAKQQEYIEEHVYDPISINHFMELGLEPDSDQKTMPKGCDNLIVPGENISNVVEKIHGEEAPVDVISPKTANLLEQLMNIGKP